MYSTPFKISATATVLPAVAGQKLYILGMFLMADAALTVQATDTDDAALTGTSGSGGLFFYPAANGGAILPHASSGPAGDGFWFETPNGKGLKLAITGTGNLSGVIRWGKR